MDSGVTQTPKYLIKSRKQQASLMCSPESGHLYVSWYQQALGQGPQFLVQYYDGEEYQKGNISDRLSREQLSGSRSELSLTPLELPTLPCISVPAAKTQPCVIRCLWDKNTPAQAQEVVFRVSAASLPSPVSGRAIVFARHLLLGMF